MPKLGILKSRRKQIQSRQRLSRMQAKRIACFYETLEARLAMAAIEQWFERGAGGGGALFSPSINPVNPDEIYIASDMGQVFRTTNEGVTWQTVDFREIQGSNNSKVQFTINPQILYSLDYSTGGDFIRPTKSTDGGATWTPLAADPTGAEAFTVVADYNNPNRLLVSSYNRLYISTDGGASFQQRFSTSDGNGLHIGGAFFDGNNIYVGTNQGVLVSNNGGASFSVAPWTGIGSGQRILSFAGAKENGTTRFWIVTADAGDVYAGVPGSDHSGYAGIYRLDVGQTSWTSITSGITSGASPFFVSAALNDIDTVYVSGGSSVGRPTVFKSTSGGSSWQSVLQTVNNANVQTGWSGDGGNRNWTYGENAMGFTVSPLDPNRIVITDFGFAHYSEDGGASWRALYVNPADLNPAGVPIPPGESYRSSGLDNTSVWGMTWTSPTHVIANNSDIRGVQSYDGGASWGFNYTGHTSNTMYRSFVHPTTGIVYAATSTVHDMYQSTHLSDSSINGGSGSVLFSTDGGTTWQTMRNFGRVVTWVEADPTNSNRLYASIAHSTDGGIYVTNNAQLGAAATWTKLPNPPRIEGHAFNIRVLNDGTLVTTFSGRRTDAGFTASSGVFVSTNGGQSWQDRSASGMLYWTKDVVIDPHDATQNTWYTTVFSGWGGAPNGLGGLYKTTDRGASWTKINNLDRVNSITVSPTNPNEAYLTTEVDGLWYTENLRSANPTFTQVAGYKFMQPMRVEYNPYNTNEVWVTSFGGGMRVGYTTPPANSPGAVSLSQPTYTISEDGTSLLVTVTRSGGTSGAVAVAYATANGTALAGQDYTATSGNLSWSDGESGSKTFSIPILNDAIFESNEAFTIALSNPTNGLTLGDHATATVTITNDDAQPQPGVVALSQPTYTVSEDGSSLLVTVSRGGGTSGAVSVAYTTANGTALAGQDYTATSGILNWGAGESGAKTFSIPLINDALVESNETFTITLSNPTNGLALGSPASATVTIQSEDVPALPGVLQFAQAAYTIGEAGGSVLVSVLRSGGDSGAVSINFATTNGTALAGQDYTTTSGVLTWAAGETGPKTISIPILNDAIFENPEAFSITLSNPTGGATVGSPASATVTINSEDAQPLLSFSAAAYQVVESLGQAIVTVVRSGNLAGAIAVAYNASPGTATGNADFTPTSGVLSFADGESQKTFAVPILNDPVDELIESIQLSLSNPTNGAALGQHGTALLEILDDDEPAPPTGAAIYQFESTLYPTREDYGLRTVYIIRSGDYSQPGTVQLTTHDGTAIAGSDYVARQSTVAFAAGERIKQVDIKLVNNSTYEPTETLTVQLSSPTGGTLGQKTSATIRIDDDEVNAPGVIQFDRATYQTREDYGYANIYLKRTAGSIGEVTVQFAITPLTAQPGEDYQPVVGTVTFASGQTTATARVYLVNDYRLESLETAQLTLSNPTGGAVLGPQTAAILAIADDEINSPGALAFSTSNFNTQENYGYVRIYVERTDGLIGQVSVDFSVGGGTAQAGVHYKTVSGTLTFADGERVKHFDVPLINNKTYGGTHTLGLTLANPGGGARLGTKSTALVTIFDDEKPK